MKCERIQQTAFYDHFSATSIVLKFNLHNDICSDHEYTLIFCIMEAQFALLLPGISKKISHNFNLVWSLELLQQPGRKSISLTFQNIKETVKTCIRTKVYEHWQIPDICVSLW